MIYAACFVGGFWVGMLIMASLSTAKNDDSFAESVYRERFRQALEPQAFARAEIERETLPIARKYQRRDREFAAAKLTRNLGGRDS